MMKRERQQPLACPGTKERSPQQRAARELERTSYHSGREFERTRATIPIGTQIDTLQLRHESRPDKCEGTLETSDKTRTQHLMTLTQRLQRTN